MHVLPEHQQDIIQMMRDSFARPLPGRAAQYAMAHQHRDREEVSYAQNIAYNKQAGVVLLIFAEEDVLKIVLIARALNARDAHSGQISFPGGRIEHSDMSEEAGALRELEEEVGVAAAQVEILGKLTELYIPVSGFLVHPFVAFSASKPQFKPQQSEVSTILTPKLGFFLDSTNVKYKDLILNNGFTLRGVPYFDVEGHVLWGATAMILSEFKSMLITQSLDQN